MTPKSLTPDVVFELLQSGEAFPVDFDDAMRWWDARTKDGKSVRRDNLIRTLKSQFFEKLDFLKFEEPLLGNGSSPHRYYLSIECFKMMGMMLSGARGRQIRQYFLDCEAELKRRIEQEKRDFRGRIIKAFVSDAVVTRRPRFSDEFYELLYQKRGQGWEERNPKNRPSCVGTWTNQIVYDRFPDGVKDRLNEVNPRVKKRRKHKHHEHLKPMGSDHLDAYLPALMAIARISPDGDWDKFMRNVRKGLPNGEPLQTSLLDLLEEYEEIDQVS